MSAIAITPEVIIGLAGVLGGILLALKKAGLITIGKPTERRDCAKKCGEHEQIVADAKIALTESRLTATGLKDDIKEIKNDLIEIRDTIEGREGNIQAEFRRIREMLGDLSGYVRGLHDKK